MAWIYFSPHFDDVALSCGGLVWEQAQSGETVSIWTVCAGQPPAGRLSPFAKELHARWMTGEAAARRRQHEDMDSCHRLGAGSRYFNIPDCIYRRHPKTGKALYASESSLTGPLRPGDASTILSLTESIQSSLGEEMALVCPLAIGNHVDHQLTRIALEVLERSLWYYEDYPYVLRDTEQLDKLKEAGWESQTFTISSQGLAAWQDAVAAHASQISTFWGSEAEMRQAIAQHCLDHQGVRLWKKRPR